VKPCPVCGETIRDESSICPHCWTRTTAPDTLTKQPRVFRAVLLLAAASAILAYLAC